MKKFLAMLLAAMMLLSCAGAMADGVSFNRLEGADQITFTEGSPNTNDDSRLEIDPEHTSRYQNEKGTVNSGDVKTELWMQVDASGQIDVTVPLVLVFSTNVDGGKAQEANNYVIYNNNTRNSVAIDKIEVTNGVNPTPMTLQSKETFVAEKNDGADKRNYYYVVFEPVKNDETATSPNGIGIAMDTKVHTGTKGADDQIYYDMFNATTANPVGATHYNTTNSTEYALMTIGQGGSINLKPTMETTPLNFVTANFQDTGSDGMADEFKKGVHLLTVTYTVGLQYTDAQGADIETTDDIEIVTTTGNTNP